MVFHVMIIPTLNCPSNCKYCWGSENKNEMMDIKIINQIVDWLKDFRDDKIHFTFHGGEPLLAGYDYYEYALEKLSSLDNFEGFSLQSNIWLLTEELIDLFKEYSVVISTSIDGPREINDFQRGKGYFDKTMSKFYLARDKGLQINFVLTVRKRRSCLQIRDCLRTLQDRQTCGQIRMAYEPTDSQRLLQPH